MIVAVFICVCALLVTTGILRGLRWFDRQLDALWPSPPACSHPGAVPVDTLAGERVAWLCPACDRQLPAGHRQGVPADA